MYIHVNTAKAFCKQGSEIGVYTKKYLTSVYTGHNITSDHKQKESKMNYKDFMKLSPLHKSLVWNALLLERIVANRKTLIDQ